MGRMKDQCSTRAMAQSGGWIVAATLGLSALLVACGGSVTAVPPPGGDDPLLEARRAAAEATAASASNDCAAIRPFYWEIGDAAGVLAAGSVRAPGDDTVYRADTVLGIASASKWLYGAYVMEARGGALSADDVRYLTFRSGYTGFTLCLPTNTVQACAELAGNDRYRPEHDGLFHYGGGHMQQHALQMGLGPLANRALADELRTRLGAEIALGYSQPQLAGGVETSAAEYAKFLRKLLDGRLRLGAALGQHAVCTNPATCAEAANAPTPAGESWHYAIGHWVEDDPVVGDGAFSSLGLFGFYPWIDRSRTWYGIVSRFAVPGAYDSLDCGRIIRRAWTTATPQ